VSPSVPAVISDDAAKAREGPEWFVAFYLVSMGTLYRQSLTRQGFGKAVEAVLAAKCSAVCRRGAACCRGTRRGPNCRSNGFEPVFQP